MSIDSSEPDTNRITAIIKPTHECNFRCEYCYASTESLEKEWMTELTLRNLIEQLMTTFDEVDFIWHGGEPLLMGLNFFKEVRRLQKDINPNFKLRNRIQTNGTLLTKKFLNFFKEENFGIGISLDGPKYLHDCNRVYPDGSGTFDDVMRSVNLMKRKEMRIKVICVLNKYNLDKIDEIYDFFNKNQLDIEVNPVVPSGRGRKNPELCITPEEYGNTTIKLFKRWFYDKNSKIKIYSFEDKIEEFLTGIFNRCFSADGCMEHFIGIDPSGEVYPCSVWTGIRGFEYGNINKTPLNQILKSGIRQKMINRTQKMIEGECKSCNWRGLCKGGCLRNAYLAHGTVYSKDCFCVGKKMIFDHISKEIDHNLNLLNNVLKPLEIWKI